VYDDLHIQTIRALRLVSVLLSPFAFPHFAVYSLQVFIRTSSSRRVWLPSPKLRNIIGTSVGLS